MKNVAIIGLPIVTYLFFGLILYLLFEVEAFYFFPNHDLLSWRLFILILPAIPTLAIIRVILTRYQ